MESLQSLRERLQQRRRALVRRAPTDHGLGYCACFSKGSALIPASGILDKPAAPARDRISDATEKGERVARSIEVKTVK